MGHPIRLELNRVGLLVGCFFRFCIGLYRGHCCVIDFSSFSFSLSQSVLLVCFYLNSYLLLDVIKFFLVLLWVVVCVCV